MCQTSLFVNQLIISLTLPYTTNKMSSFKRFIKTSKIKEYRILLQNESLLEDEHIESLFYLMAYYRDIDKKKINIIQPCIIDAIMNYNLDTATEKELDNQSRGRDIIFVPICTQNHWSLLVKKMNTNQWYHIDSCGSYHSEYASQVLYALAGHNQYIHITSPRQSGGKECGIYVLFYMLIIITTPESPNQWESDVHYVKEENRIQFVETLITLLDKEIEEIKIY